MIILHNSKHIAGNCQGKSGKIPLLLIYIDIANVGFAPALQKLTKGRYCKMRIKVYGKSHLEGVAKKTGNPYNFNQVHYLGKARNVEGLAAQTLALDPFDYPIDHIEVGREYDVEFDNRGYVVGFVPVK